MVQSRNQELSIPLLKAAVWAAALAPLGWLIYRLFAGALGPDPGQAITENLGLTAFQLLLATLLVTPVRRITGWAGWLKVRRLLGLFAFFYAVLHVLAFLQFILGWGDLWATFTQRPYIIAGSLGFLMLVPLAASSTKGMMRRLGRNWKPVHRLIYPAIALVWVHFLWQARSDITEMVVYGLLVILLLALRVYWFGVRSLVPLKS